ncbi:MAG: IclR family transcriptional regulator C-terminal domain-containing protein [Paracoccus sp. (in: a-proteobacteria)]|nr:IclR family transcriptional regulator C-terminal domain-containing protein [Paracoccus sp. (in: a-proteobacteria)]
MEQDHSAVKPNSLDKMLAILDGFDEQQVVIDVDRASQLSGSSRPSTYRYIQALTRSGLLTPASGGTYALGSRVIELEMLRRANDPLHRASHHLIRHYAQTTGLNIMVCSYYGDKVLCTDFAWADHSIPGIYRPGLSMPLFRGAMAKVILANHSQARLRSVWNWNEAALREAGLGQSLAEFLDAMAVIRTAGAMITRGEVFNSLVGVAAPVFDLEEQVLGSVVFVLQAERFGQSDPEKLKEEIRELSRGIQRGIDRANRFEAITIGAAAKPRRSPVYAG